MSLSTHLYPLRGSLKGRSLRGSGALLLVVASLLTPQLFTSAPTLSPVAYAQGSGPWEVIVNAADIYAGPSKAYSVRGRAYLGQKLQVIGTSPRQDWLQVVTPEGKKGWVTAESMRNPGRQVAQDPGRFRRQTDYQYDAQGRRMNSAGQTAGSGQGFGQGQAMQGQPQGQVMQGQPQGQVMQGQPQGQVMEGQPQGQVMQGQVVGGAPPGFGGAGKRSGGLSVRVIPAGLNLASRRFASDVRVLSPLAKVESESLLYQYGAELSYELGQNLIIQAKGSDARGAGVTVPAHPDRPNFQPVTEVETSMSVVGLSVMGGLPMGKLWLGGGLGAQYMLHAFNEIPFALADLAGFTPLQSHSYLSATAGLSAKLTLNSFEMAVNGGVLLPLSMSAEPYEIGPWEGFGYYGDLRFGLMFTELLGAGLFMGGQYMGVDVTGTGAYSDRTYIYNDKVENVGAPKTYKRASTTDRAINGGLYVQLSL